MAGDRGPERNRQRQRNWHRPHPQVTFVALDHLRILLKGGVDPVENGVVFDLKNEDQSRLWKRKCPAGGQRDLDLIGLVEGEERAALPAKRAEQFVEFLARRRLDDTIQLFESCFRLGESGLVHLCGDNVPDGPKIDVGETGPNGVRREPIQFVQWARRATKDGPDAAGGAVGVAADHELGLVETLLQRDAADADPTDRFDAAVLDEARNEIKRLIEIGFFSIAKIGQRQDGPAPAVDAIRKAFEPLARTEVGIEAAAGIELSGDRAEAGLFRGDDRRRGLGRLQRRGALHFFFAASICCEQEEDCRENKSRWDRTIFGGEDHRLVVWGANVALPGGKAIQNRRHPSSAAGPRSESQLEARLRERQHCHP